MMINKRLIGTVKESKKYIAGNVICQWISLAANITMMGAIAHLLQNLYEGKQDGFAVTAIIAAIAVVIRFVCATASSRMGYLSSKAVKKTLREMIYKKLLRLGASYKEQTNTSEVVQVAVEGVDQLETYFGAYLPQFFYALNDMHIPARKGEWSQTSIVNILTNEVYLGKIRWRREPVKKVVKDGFLAKTRILNDDYELYDGMHEPIITEEQWEMAKAVKKKKGHHSTHATKELKNPFAGILFCEKCGAALKRNVPGKNQGTAPWFRCPTRGCDCRIVKCHTVEEAIRDAMEDWLDEYIIQLHSESKPKVDPIATALEAVQAQLAGLQQQQDTLCDYLEKGVYTIDMFTKRNATLAREIKMLQESEADLMQKKESGTQANQAAMEIIPTTQHILDNYDVLTIAEKNRLWKLVLKKATVYRTPDGELSVHIYPKLPK